MFSKPMMNPTLKAMELACSTIIVLKSFINLLFHLFSIFSLYFCISFV